MLPVTIGIIIGGIISCQTAINSRLRAFIGSPYQASFVSFTIGTLFLALVTLASHQSLGVSSQILAQEPWWLWIGGFLGVIFLTTNILLFPHIGAVQTAIMPILGQVLMGLLIDTFGWLTATQQSLTPARLFGVILVLIGILVTVALPDILQHQTTTTTSGNPWPWRLLGIVGGALGAVQTTINGHLGVVLNSAVHASFISFLIGAMTLLVIVFVVDRNLSHIANATGHGKPWWIWLGGLLGGVFVLSNTYLAPILGTGQTVVFALLGQLTGGLLIDQFGLLGAKRNPTMPVQFLGLLCLVGGVILIRLF